MCSSDLNRYINVMKKLQKAIPDFYGKEDITFHELNSDFIDRKSVV